MTDLFNTQLELDFSAPAPAPSPASYDFTEESKTIAWQLGGLRNMKMFTGLKSFTYHKDFCGLTLILPLAKHGWAVNKVHIRLNDRDFYDMVFSQTGKQKDTEVARVNDAFVGDLVHHFEKCTGLYIRF